MNMAPVDLKAEELGTARQKRHDLKKRRDELLDQMEHLSNKTNFSDIDQERFDDIESEVTTLSAQFQRAQAKVDDLTSELIELGGDPKAHEKPLPSFVTGQEPSGARSLGKDGKTKLYNAGQSIAADHYATGNTQDVELGDYLRAVVRGPQSQPERTAIQNSVSGDSYHLPAKIAAQLIDKLRAANPLLKEGGAGAQTLTLDGGETKFIRTDADPQAVWHAELTDETPSDPAFSAVSMSPFTLLSLTEVSREVLQDSKNIEEALVNSFIGAM